jgi:hypothetical protein
MDAMVAQILIRHGIPLLLAVFQNYNEDGMTIKELKELAGRMKTPDEYLKEARHETD